MKKDKDEFSGNLWISNRALAITSLVISILSLFITWIQLS